MKVGGSPTAPDLGPAANTMLHSHDVIDVTICSHDGHAILPYDSIIISGLLQCSLGPS